MEPRWRFFGKPGLKVEPRYVQAMALAGAAIGVAISYAAVDGATISTLGGALFDSQLVYSLSVSPALVTTAIVLAATLGLCGGLLPAIRAARGNIAATLHEK